MISAPDDNSESAEVADVVTSRSDDELVGPGGYPLRIQPAAALRPGRSDARNLLIIWFLRKSFYWLFFVGMTIGLIASTVRDEEADFAVRWSSPSSVESGLLSAWSLVVVAIVLRFVVAWVALAMAWPLARAHDVNLEPRTNFGRGIGTFFDRLNLARAFRSLRWTHHVRLVARRRLGRNRQWVGKLDPILDVVNILAGVTAFVAPMIVAVVLAS